MQTTTLALLVALALPACEAVPAQTATPLTHSQIATYGEWWFPEPPDRVFAATRDALRTLGYTIAVERPERGLLVTGRLLVSEETRARGVWGRYGWTAASATTTPIFRQYTVTVYGVGAGASEVTAAPSFFVGDVDWTWDADWDLPAQRARWWQLRAAIAALL